MNQTLQSVFDDSQIEVYELVSTAEFVSKVGVRFRVEILKRYFASPDQPRFEAHYYVQSENSWIENPSYAEVAEPTAEGALQSALFNLAAG